MAEVQPGAQPPWWRRHWLVLLLSGLGLIGLLGYAVLAATVLPAWIVSMSGVQADENHRLDAISNTRGALLGLLAPVVVAIGAVAAFLNYRVAATNLAVTADQNRRTYELSQKALDETQRQNRETLDVTRRGQLTERFTKAIDQLGQTAEDKLDIRLGGIYALEQIAKESAELHGPVMEILTAFLREHSRQPRETPTARPEDEERAADEADHAPTKEAATEEAATEEAATEEAATEEAATEEAATEEAATEEATLPLRADFQAIATVLGRRQVSQDPDGFTLDLRGVLLGRADFTHAQLREANFAHAQLREANFNVAQLRKADFTRAQLKWAGFMTAELQGADFDFARLQGAGFYSARLQGAKFRNAELQEAIFRDADFKEAKLGVPGTDRYDAHGLTWEQLAEARNVHDAVLPSHLTKESRPDVRPAE